MPESVSSLWLYVLLMLLWKSAHGKKVGKEGVMYILIQVSTISGNQWCTVIRPTHDMISKSSTLLQDSLVLYGTWSFKKKR